jgi:Eco57I restriction endonuclease.
MNLNKLTPRKALNKAFLKVKPNRSAIECFKNNLIKLIDQIDEIETEEFHKNIVSAFLRETYYGADYYINTKGRNDLVIHNGKDAPSSVGVIIETKKPANKTEMLTVQNLNAKAFHELVLYYLRERITAKNNEIKYLIATDIYEWFIFDAALFEKAFGQNKRLVKQFKDFEEGRLVGKTTDFFYKEIAESVESKIETDITFTHFDIREYEKPLRNANNQDDTALVALYKLLSPEHLLKLPFANDSNSLDKSFYTELLHIIGLEETKEGGKKLIQRKKENERNTSSLIENCIIQLESLDKISRLEKPDMFGATDQERLYNVALELAITWINRILFLKLLEAQQINYHKGDNSYAFLNSKKVRDFEDLNSLFFSVLARKQTERNSDVRKLFANVPYLNSSLFEPTDIEHSCLFISQLKDGELPILHSTVLKDTEGKKRTGKLNTLDYLFEFLDAYDFSNDGAEDIQEENKTLINASVLGLIFEKINGYKDGSFFTPGFITMYMCRETIRRAVIQKFNEVKKWDCKDLNQLFDKIEDKKETNDLINSLKICDPAVGSGHFLVSALNEIIAIKSELKVLLDRQGKTLRDYQVEVVNDELIITDDDGQLFEYNPKSKESQNIQETLFHEKQTIIENCLFGVDINPNSVKICRLRLWIELLKNAYYTAISGYTELETLPNIDINIKCGNSLISRYALDSDIKKALQKSKWKIESYCFAVMTYRNAKTKEEKREMEKLINEIKHDFEVTIIAGGKEAQQLEKLRGEVENLILQTTMFGMTQKQKQDWEKNSEKATKALQDYEQQIEDIKSSKIYHNAFEWRFEFPEVLNDEGDFVGFNVVIGNPPYGVEYFKQEKELFKEIYPHSSQGKIDSYKLFFERAFLLTRKAGMHSFIAPNTYLYNLQSKELRSYILKNSFIINAIELRKNIFEDAPDVVTVINISKLIKADKDWKTNAKVAFPNKKYSNIDNDEWEICQEIPYRIFIDDSEMKINLRRNFKLDEIINKMNQCKRLGDFFETKQGTKPYGVKAKKKYVLLSKEKKGDEWEAALNGRNISQFSFSFENDYVKRCPELHSCLPEEIVFNDKIYFQRMRKISLFPRIVACFDNESMHGLYTCSVIYKSKSNNLNLKFLLALLNSNLINVWYKNYDTDIEIKLASVKAIPIANISTNEQKPIIDIVNEIIAKKKKKTENNILKLIGRLDYLIYKLYDLTEDEIRIVEGETK